MSISQLLLTYSNYSPSQSTIKRFKFEYGAAELPPRNFLHVKCAAYDLVQNLRKSCFVLMLYSLPHYMLAFRFTS